MTFLLLWPLGCLLIFAVCARLVKDEASALLCAFTGCTLFTFYLLSVFQIIP